MARCRDLRLGAATELADGQTIPTSKELRNHGYVDPANRKAKTHPVQVRRINPDTHRMETITVERINPIAGFQNAKRTELLARRGTLAFAHPELWGWSHKRRTFPSRLMWLNRVRAA